MTVVHDGHVAEVEELWESRSRITLTPIAAPSILGLFGFAGATLIVASNLAGWYGNDRSSLYLAPFAAAFGGLAQFIAGMFAYRARDGLATAMHGMWGSFWLGYGLLNLLFATGALTAPTGVYFPELGFWFIALAAITLMGALASLAENLSLFAVLATLTAGSALMAGASLDGSMTIRHVAGWVLVFSAGFAWYTASAMMLRSTFKRTILPVFRTSSRAALRESLPGSGPIHLIEYERGMPGVKVGQ